MVVLLKHKANVNKSHLCGAMTLHFLSSLTIFKKKLTLSVLYLGYESSVKVLLKHGADVNKSDLCGATALHFASEEGNTDCARLLCRAGLFYLNKGNKA